MDGRIRLADFEPKAFEQEAVRTLLGKVEARGHEGSFSEFAAEVTVTMQNGTTFSALNDVDMGRGLNNPMSDQELWEKFEDCAQRSLEDRAIRPLFERLNSLESADRLSQVTAMAQHPRSEKKGRCG